MPVTSGKQRVLLAALLLNADRPISVDELADLLWESGPPPSARVTVQNLVKRLRRALGDADHSRIATLPDGYLIGVSDEELDVSRFEASVARARQSASVSQWQRAAIEYRDALSLWRGEPLAGIPCERLALEHAPRLAEMRLQAMEAKIDADLHLGRHAELIAELQGMVAVQPLRERLHALLMLALYRAGRQADALAAYRDARRLLIDEVGVEPGAELQRLHSRILEADPGLTGPAANLAHPAQPSLAPRQLPRAVAHFIGRDAELKRLDGLLDRAASGNTVVISGTAGVGKTALAVHWAHQVAGHFPDGQLYVDLRGFGPAETPVAATETLRGFLDSLQVPAARIPPGLDAQVGLYRSLLAGRRILIILDNARDASQVRPLLPGTAGSIALITSRDAMAGLAATEGVLALTLDVLGASEARELLAVRLGADRDEREPDAAAELTGLCARLPLALSIVAARAAAHPGFPLAALSSELRDARSRLDVLDAGEAAASVRAVFSWSYRNLSAPAARMFRLLGVHPGPDITAAAAASMAGIPAKQARMLLSELARCRLVTEHTAGRFALHDLLRLYAAEQAAMHETAVERRSAARRLLDHYLHTAHAMSRLLDPSRHPGGLPAPESGVQPEDLRGYREAWSWAEAEHDVLLALSGLASYHGLARHAWQIPWALETYLFRRGRWHSLVAIQRTALEAAGTLGDASGQAHAHCSLGLAGTLLGSYEEAHSHLVSASRLFGEAGDCAGEARARIRMCNMFWRQRRYSEALVQSQYAGDLFRACGHRAGQAGAINNIGWYHIELGDYERGMECCQDALTMFREIGDRRGEGNALDSLGYLHHRTGRHAEAAGFFGEALKAFLELGDRYNQAEVITHLAEAHRASGNTAAARSNWQQALTILSDLSHPDAVGVLAKLRDLENARPGGGAAAHTRTA